MHVIQTIRKVLHIFCVQNVNHLVLVLYHLKHRCSHQCTNFIKIHYENIYAFGHRNTCLNSYILLYTFKLVYLAIKVNSDVFLNFSHFCIYIADKTSVSVHFFNFNSLKVFIRFDKVQYLSLDLTVIHFQNKMCMKWHTFYSNIIF